ncbi:GNAT family N-acetyltransferase [Paenibacillus sp. S150]|uniref:GNAT family N-acetyltransferase n=1 Tax=Paenibacillus sp. S150 TaxID=2749826 RepID=UPI001C5870BF|nr:GNAT family N-acetyltransferase [Paenibacillus sp. S150]MBW4083472.1 GNAT family N-acetyltransferase [Paenibacillus sp. S150]
MKSELFIPILLDFSESFETERLLVRAPQWGDGQAVNEAVRESLEELKPWMPFAQSQPSLEESEYFARDSRLKFLNRSQLNMLVFRKSDDAFIGCTGLHHINWDARCFEAGYWIRTSCAGNGYITEAVNGVTAFAIKELEANRIEIRCSGRNARSAAVAERAGFTLDGILRRSTRSMDGELHDSRIYAKVRGAEF